MMVARPCVSTDLVGIPDLVIDGRTGLLVRPRDPVALAGAIEALLGDPARAGRLGREAERRARAHFTIDEAVDRLRTLFEGAMAEPGVAPPRARLDPAPTDDGRGADPASPPPAILTSPSPSPLRGAAG
jgi:hypothetical protein